MTDGLKRTELRRRTPLERTTPMRRTGFTATATSPLVRKAPIKPRSSALKSAAKPTARRSTGPSEKMRDAVLARDSNSCQRCGRRLLEGVPYSLQHRLPRGRQGRNTMTNLVAVCGSATTPGMCHDWMEHTDRPQATLDGWLVPSWDEVVPENWAVKRFDGTWAVPGVDEWTVTEPHPKQVAA